MVSMRGVLRLQGASHIEVAPCSRNNTCSPSLRSGFAQTTKKKVSPPYTYGHLYWCSGEQVACPPCSYTAPSGRSTIDVYNVGLNQWPLVCIIILTRLRRSINNASDFRSFKEIPIHVLGLIFTHHNFFGGTKNMNKLINREEVEPICKEIKAIFDKHDLSTWDVELVLMTMQGFNKFGQK